MSAQVQDAVVGSLDGHSPPALAHARGRETAAVTDESAHWSGGEIGYSIALFGGLLVAIAGTAFALVAGVWVFHFIAHQILPGSPATENYRLATAWGNAIGTILVIVLGFVMILATLLTMGERKWSAFIQDRMGPNRARIQLPGLKDKALWGLPHIAADVLKMLTKEEIVPKQGNQIVFHLAPALAFGPAFVLFAVIPMAPTFQFGPPFWPTLIYPITMQVANINQGLLYVFAIASLAVLGTSLAGWSSNNKYALLGGVRASAQMVSYEVTLGMTLVGLMIVYRTLRLDVMAAAEGQYLWGWLPAWGLVFQPLAIIAYFAAASAEIKRAPFDLPEGESEIVGYFIEYSGLKFGIFMIAEFVEVVVFAGLFTTLFFGAYHLPWGEQEIRDALLRAVSRHTAEMAMGLIYVTSFLVKTIFFCWLSLTVRWTFPRFRYDQVMDLGWKMLLPLSLLNVIITAVAVLVGGREHAREAAAIVGLVELGVLLAFVIGAFKINRTGDETLLPSAGAGHSLAAAHGDHH